jgi:hypothetical protein
VDVALAGVTLAASTDVARKQRRGRGTAFLLGVLVGAAVVGGLGGLLWLGGRVRLNLLDRELEERSAEARSLEEREADLRRRLAEHDNAIAERQSQSGELQKQIQQQHRQVAEGKEALALEQAVASLVKAFSDEWTGERRKKEQKATADRAELGDAKKKLGDWAKVQHTLERVDRDLSRSIGGFIRDPSRKTEFKKELSRRLRSRIEAEVAARDAKNKLEQKLLRLDRDALPAQRMALIADIERFIEDHGDTLLGREFPSNARIARIVEKDLCEQIKDQKGKPYELAKANAQRIEAWLAQGKK